MPPFNDLIGNENAKSLLMRLVTNGRVPGAMLFSGPEGVGKKLFAFELARLLSCSDKGCGDCPICARIGQFEMPDADKKDDHKKVILSAYADVGMVIPYKRNILVDSIRDLEQEAYVRPFEGAKRIFIVEEADKMNDAASNALLKTLEEPPATTHLILVSSRPDSLLQTIRSRCQTVRFSPVAASEIETLLLASGKLAADDALLAARVSGGSVGKALSLDPEWFRSAREVMAGVLRSAIVTGEIGRMLQTSEQINDAKNKDRFEDSIEILQTLIRDVYALKKSGNAADIVNADLAGEILDLAHPADAAKLATWITEIEDLLASLNVNANRKIATDKLFVSMTA